MKHNSRQAKVAIRLIRNAARSTQSLRGAVASVWAIDNIEVNPLPQMSYPPSDHPNRIAMSYPSELCQVRSPDLRVVMANIRVWKRNVANST